MQLTLLVIRSAIPDQLAEFYSLLGLTFEYHRHGQSPYHYSTNIGPTVLEIYPLTKSQEKADNTIRLGLSIDSFDMRMQDLTNRNITFHHPPSQTEWGFMAIIADPEGRKIELYKEQH
jgi:hypothetical protein